MDEKTFSYTNIHFVFVQILIISFMKLCWWPYPSPEEWPVCLKHTHIVCGWSSHGFIEEMSQSRQWIWWNIDSVYFLTLWFPSTQHRQVWWFDPVHIQPVVCVALCYFRGSVVLFQLFLCCLVFNSTRLAYVIHTTNYTQWTPNSSTWILMKGSDCNPPFNVT